MVLVSGWTGAMDAVVTSLLAPGTVAVRHDLSRVAEGVVRRTLSVLGEEPRESILELAHGCVSCTLREDLLPLLRALSTRSNVDRIVLAMDPALEPEALCWAVDNVVVAGVVGRIDGPASRDVRIEAVVDCLDAATWLADATGDDAMADRGVVASGDDDRTVAQLVVGQVDYADALVVTAGSDVDAWERARLAAVLARLAPNAPVVWVSQDALVDAPTLLASVPADARRGAISDAHSPLLRGQPPLTVDCGITLVEFTATRPFHPERFHEAIDVLLDGVVTARGRAWVATQPDEALWIESAGGGLRVASAGKWLATMTPEQQDRVDATRRAMSALRWDEKFGDRDTSLVILVHEADPTEIDRTLQWALVSDDEMADPAAWSTWNDPFGHWHEDPCESSESPYAEQSREATE
ncbi:cobalamin biosynthesis protein CobW [Rhodococcus sp. 15-725-2-2b]|uniref:ribosome hibernation factor-recruiting GTPase MRF n=1 Tax=unclassified Rhodococcus (in: high G+C Gram-positive bacteria) TaxID=192944 RepID=UPI000B9A870C|nr:MULTISPECIES: GTP-binding protein [unclassified Rhodococcus (in: high G+C Gram-positive bacteria)]OZC72829.1 cobalamin biosynthesis protein CobW [Rhodococcus sp. 06-469-3-2]OZD49047.1 cobalamin biosynthesis protein CobW [Rhodococcus sp. 06-1477-1A]OZE77972.1 cobalamin biosynthesis protein CobW [Rhodococcus sp. 15-725-2-2b]